MGYWPSVRSRWQDIGQVLSFFACLWTERKNKANICHILTEQAWSIKDLLYDQKDTKGSSMSCFFSSRHSISLFLDSIDRKRLEDLWVDSEFFFVQITNEKSFLNRHDSKKLSCGNIVGHPKWSRWLHLDLAG